jgi:F0F1-type ATP synthase membrane subunit b/b'
MKTITWIIAAGVLAVGAFVFFVQDNTAEPTAPVIAEPEEVLEEGEAATEDAAATLQEQAEGVVQTATEQAQGAVETVTEQAEALADQATGAASEAAEGAEDILENAIGEVVNSVSGN